MQKKMRFDPFLQ